MVGRLGGSRGSELRSRLAKARPGGGRSDSAAPRSAGLRRRARKRASTSDLPRLFERSERSERSELCAEAALTEHRRGPAPAGPPAQSARSAARPRLCALGGRARSFASLRMRAAFKVARSRHLWGSEVTAPKRNEERASRRTATPSSRCSCARPSSRRWAYSDDALARPIVGIANTFSDYNACHGNVPQLVEAIKRGVMLAGGLPMEFPTISIHESFAHPTSMFLRNLMAMDTEEMIRAQPMDAVVLIGGCDKTIPAQLMAAASADVPAIVVAGRADAGRPLPGRALGACTDCRRLWGEYRAGGSTRPRSSAINERLAPTAGTCMVMGTASTMACIVEAMGMALPRGVDSGDACRPPALGRGERRARRRDGARRRPDAERDDDRGRVSQRAGRAAGDRRLDQRAGPPDRGRRPARHRDRPRRVRPRSAARCRCWST